MLFFIYCFQDFFFQQFHYCFIISFSVHLIWVSLSILNWAVTKSGKLSFSNYFFFCCITIIFFFYDFSGTNVRFVDIAHRFLMLCLFPPFHTLLFREDTFYCFIFKFIDSSVVSILLWSQSSDFLSLMIFFSYVCILYILIVFPMLRVSVFYSFQKCLHFLHEMLLYLL